MAKARDKRSKVSRSKTRATKKSITSKLKKPMKKKAAKRYMRQAPGSGFAPLKEQEAIKVNPIITSYPPKTAEFLNVHLDNLQKQSIIIENRDKSAPWGDLALATSVKVHGLSETRANSEKNLLEKKGVTALIIPEEGKSTYYVSIEANPSAKTKQLPPDSPFIAEKGAVPEAKAAETQAQYEKRTWEEIEKNR